jgi:4-amino-4-deoxy-L-arabinose transferase-like glycosyltransferase
LSAATQLSATIDEGFHITSGYEYLRTGRLRLFDEHTPLGKGLMAWTLFFLPDLPPPEGASGWIEGDLIQVARETTLAYRPLDRVIVPPRVVVALLTVVLAAMIYRWAANWFGPTAGLFSLTLFAFDPNILAHGSLATTDMAATVFIFGAVWAFIRFLKSPTPRRWWLAAVLLGLAQVTKLTALLLLPLLGLLLLLEAVFSKRPVLKRLLSYAGMVAVAVLVLWALYLFEMAPVPELTGEAFSLPAPGHAARWLRLQDNLAYGRESFLLGQNRMQGWWQYFPVAFAVKTPLPTLLFTLLTIGALVRGRRLDWPRELALGLFPLVYGAASLTSTLNIGYRHLLPVLPFLFVSTGRLVSRRWPVSRRQWWHRVRSWLLGLLILGLIVGTVRVSPHYLAYFNLISGGADEGYRFLADSNTDWGQTFKVLANYQQRHDLGPVKLSTFTFLDPAAYGVTYEPLPPMRDASPILPRRFNPAPGLYALSATTLNGVPLPLPSMYDWFRHRTPFAKLGHVMFLYEVPAGRVSDESWVAQCAIPVIPLTPEVIAEGFGVREIRRIYFDCTQSWIFPEGGESTGWYTRATLGIDVLRWPWQTSGQEQHLAWWPAWIGRRPWTNLELSYVQRTAGEQPPFSIWKWPGSSIVLPTKVGTQEVELGGMLVFLGYQAPPAARSGDNVDVLTYWRVVSLPDRPLSLMLHLGHNDGVPLAVGDGLGVPIDQWQPGDVIVQRHRLAIPPDAVAGTYSLRTGAYWLDDGTRLAASGMDALFLAALEIRD